MATPARTTDVHAASTRGDQQRAAIIDAVTDLLRTVPIADLSIGRITARTGLTRSGFYFYFGSKYAVVAAALHEVWAELDDATSALATYDFEEPPAAFSGRMIAEAIAVWRSHNALLNACINARDSDPRLGAMLDEFVGTLAGKLGAFIERMRDEGHMAPASTDIPALTHALVGMTIWALHTESDHAALAPDRVMAAVGAVWLAAAWGPAPA